MLAEHPRCKRLSVNIDKCPPSETHFCGDRTEFLKNQMEASKLTDPVKLYAVSTSSRFDYARTSYTARGKGLKGKTPSGGKSARGVYCSKFPPPRRGGGIKCKVELVGKKMQGWGKKIQG